MDERPSAPHDRVFRALVAEPERGARLVRGLLPPEVAGLVADVPLERVPGSFVDAELRFHQTDALFRAVLADGRPAWLYVLLEHKSARDPWTPLQMARYVLRVWTWHSGQRDARPGVLPPVIPVLLHHGREPWAGPLSVLDMVEAPEGIADLARSLACVLFDLGPADPESLPEDPEIRSVLAALRHSRDRSVPEDVLRAILSGPREGTELELQLAVYVAKAYDLTRERLEAALRQARPERWESLMGTVAEELVRESRDAWIARGIAEGEARGEARGKAEALLRLARLKFGDVPAPLAGEVRTAPTAALDRWLEALVSADTLEEVFGQRGPH